MGARTAVGLERLRQAPLKHGRRDAAAHQAARDRGAARREMATLDALLQELDELTQRGACP
ncbi:hypothetical protein SAMN02927895_05523 [Belnapia rosea]|nr:hypothetical protein SAMN02927895_05523 [Belnapia rosea]